MKKSLFIFCSSVLIFLNVHGQSVNTFDNYFAYHDYMMDHFYDQAAQQDILYYEVDGWKEFFRWKMDNMYHHDEFGNFTPYAEALNDYYNNFQDNETNDLPQWEYFGHEGVYDDINGNQDCTVGQGNIGRIWVDENNLDHILAGGHNGSLWRTTDGGDKWDCISDTEIFMDGHASIEVNPSNTNEIYVAQRFRKFSFGLFHTTDAEVSWSNNKVFVTDIQDNFYPTGETKKLPIKWIIHPDDEDIMYLLTYGYLLRSEDGGVEWKIIADENYTCGTGDRFTDIEFDPENPSVFYVAGPDVFRFTDLGNNDVNIDDISSDVLDPCSAGSNKYSVAIGTQTQFNNYIWFTVFAFKGGNVDENIVSLMRYTKSPEEFILLANSESYVGWLVKPQEYAMIQCEISPVLDEDNKHVIMIGAINAKICNYSTGEYKFHLIAKCSGSNWTHHDVRDAKFLVDGDENEVLIVANDGGVFSATPLSANNWSWDYLANDGSNGIRNADVLGFDCSNSIEDDIIYVGFRDMEGALKIEEDWYNIFDQDATSGIVDKTNPDNIFGSIIGGENASFKRSTDGGQNFEDDMFSVNIGQPPIKFKPDDPNCFYVGNKQKLQKFGNVWETPLTDETILTISDDESGVDYYGDLRVRELAICELNPDVIYVSTQRYFPEVVEYAKAIYKTVDGGDNWTDISANLINGLQFGSITGLAINPNNQNEVWACFGGCAFSEDANLAKKVYHSIDAGLTWTPMASGLHKEIPANDIYYDQVADRLYLATDVGVYFCNANEEVWYNFSNGLPPTNVDMIRCNNALNKIRVATKGRGLWQAEIPCYSDNNTVFIYSDTPWDTERHEYSDIVVESGATLTITSQVHIPADKKIIVKRGAKLVLDGGTITNSYCGPWQGILVYGHSGQAQDYTYQGLVAVLNGGTIENAVCGVSTIKYSDPGNPEDDLTPDYYYTGGIIRCDDAVFRNNQTAIKFWDYSFDDSESFFRDCQFITDDQLLAGIDPGYFIEMTDISGIKIQASTFTDTRTMANPIDLTSGVLAYDGHFEVFNSGSQNCIFTGLYYGIKAYAHGPGKFISIKNTSFDDNSRGVYICGMSNAEITDNNFNINSPYSSFNGGYGLYLDHSTAYKVEENNFYHYGAVLGVGLIVNQSDGKPNQIYRNYFTSLECGMDIQGENRNQNGSGLVLKCNQYEGTFMDKIITWDIPISTPEAGIAESQGSPGSNPKDMAGNLFYVPGPSNDDNDDILNEGNHITYYIPETYDNERVIPVDYTLGTVDLEEVPEIIWTYQYGCPPTEEPGGGGGIGVIKGKMAIADNKADSTENLLTMLIDGGNTEATQTDVDNSIPPETMQVYNELMDKSPYLSDTVVSTAIEKEDVLPGAMIRDIMVANPKMAKSEKLMSKLDERWTPLPEYMKAQILAGRSIVSIREETDSKLAAFNLEREKHFNALARYYINDTIDPVGSKDSLMALYVNDNSLSAKYGMAYLNGDQGDWVMGLGILNNIPVQFELSAKEANTHSQMLLYYNLLLDLAQEGKSIFEVDEAQITTLLGIESTNAGSISAYSRNILLALGEIDYEEPIILPDMLKSSSVEAEYEDMLSKAAEAPNYIKVRPNPTKDYIILAYELEKEGGATIEIHNMNAKLKFVKNLVGKQDQFTIDTRGWKAGVYIITLMINRKLVESIKITIIN